MFSDDKSIETLQQLFREFKHYFELQKRYTQLELTEKLTILLSTLILLLVVVVLGMVVLFYLSFTLAYLLDPIVGGLMISFSLVALLHLILITVIVVFRKRFVIDPMARFIASLFVDGEK